MGIVLAKNFKGHHFWIPPIPEQENKMKELGYSEDDVKKLGIFYDKNQHKKGMVKIDAMFVPATPANSVNLVGLKNKIDNEIIQK